MVDRIHNPALQRILDRPENRAAFATLSSALSGADLTTFLLAVFADRVKTTSAADLMRQYETDRFVGASPLDEFRLARVESAALETGSPYFDHPWRLNASGLR